MTELHIIREGTVGGAPYVTVGGVGNFSVFKTFDCGQCFRFDPADPPFGEGYAVSGVARGERVTFAQSGEGSLSVVGSDAETFFSKWAPYLSLDVDYDEIDRIVTTALDPDGCAVMRRAAEAGRGIRILRQDGWEALCSFIVSQNNNIPRIKKIIAAMCEAYGEPTADGAGRRFPTAKAIYDAGEDAIFALRTGFRAKYITDAARAVATGEIDLDAVAREEDFAACEAALMRIKGVGPKVADCALLFGFGKTEAYPVDVWMKKVAACRFKTGPDPKKFGKYAGIAQQYLFYMERYIGDE